MVAKNLMIDKIRKSSTETRRLPATSLDGLSVSEREAHYVLMLPETDAEQTEAHRDMEAGLIRLLAYKDKDREVVVLARDERLNPARIAERIGSTTEAVQKRQERLIKWAAPVMQHLEALIDCLPKENDRNVMERHLDGQSLLEITQAFGISRSDVEARVKRVIAQWKKAATQNSTDPISAMAKQER